MSNRPRLAALRRALVARVPPRARQLINARRGIDQPLAVDVLPGRRVVVLAPHPDDEVLGCGGAVLAHVAAGAAVTIVHATSGERTWSLAGASDRSRRERREGEAKRAARTLRVDDRATRFWRLPDGKLATQGALVDKVRALFRELEPDLVYAPWPLDAHGDHRAITDAVASCLAAGEREPLVALYEVWGPLVPSHIVDITPHIDRKLEALSAYQDVLAGVDYVHTARGLAAYRSGQGLGGRGFAEAFCVVTASQLGDLVAVTAS